MMCVLMHLASKSMDYGCLVGWAQIVKVDLKFASRKQPNHRWFVTCLLSIDVKETFVCQFVEEQKFKFIYCLEYLYIFANISSKPYFNTKKSFEARISIMLVLNSLDLD